jgi:hypothetical protein
MTPQRRHRPFRRSGDLDRLDVVLRPELGAVQLRVSAVRREKFGVRTTFHDPSVRGRRSCVAFMTLRSWVQAVVSMLTYGP